MTTPEDHRDDLDPAAGWPSGADLTGADLTDAELDELMASLRTIADTVDAPPPIVSELAYAAFETRDLDAELAVLTADSAVDELELVRSVATEPRLVSFETPELTVEVQIEQDGDVRTVRGLVLGAGDARGTIEVQSGDFRRTAAVDERGWFVLERVPPGPLRLRLMTEGGPVVTTEWIAF